MSLYKITDSEEFIRTASFEHLILGNANKLGSPSIEAISKLHKLSTMVPMKKDASQSLIEQAVSLKTHKMISHSLDRITEKIEQIYYIKIFMAVLHALYTSLKPLEFGYALKNLGIFEVDNLVHVLFEKVKIGLVSKADNNVIVAAIQSIFGESEQELNRTINMCTKFLILHSSGKFFIFVDVHLQAPALPQGNFFSYTFYRRDISPIGLFF